MPNEDAVALIARVRARINKGASLASIRTDTLRALCALAEQGMTQTTDVLPSEAVLAFAAWLTVRDEVAGPFSARHDAAPMAELVEEFRRSQGWEPVRDSFLNTNRVEAPDGTA